MTTCNTCNLDFARSPGGSLECGQCELRAAEIQHEAWCAAAESERLQRDRAMHTAIEQLVEVGIRPLCRALNALEGVRTLGSRQGHSVRCGPFVRFVADEGTAYDIHQVVLAGHLTGKLQLYWAVSARFADEGELLYTLELEDLRVRSWWFLPVIRRRIDDDISRLATLLSAGQAS